MRGASLDLGDSEMTGILEEGNRPPRLRSAIAAANVSFVIAKAGACDVKDAVSDRDCGSNPTADGAAHRVENLGEDKTDQQTTECICSPDEQISLVALAWLGRGTYDRSPWREALQHARAQRNARKPECLLGPPLLGADREQGVAPFGANCSQSG
jgi:Protein of unknown function (DUF3775)